LPEMTKVSPAWKSVVAGGGAQETPEAAKPEA
jgi:hypothetical protein